MKNLFLVALAAMSLVSCSNDEVMEVKQDVISFDALTDNASRAATIYSSSNKPETFIVYAVHTDSEGNKKIYINGEGVTLTADGDYAFSDGNVRYWPQEGTLTFYAVVPPLHYIDANEQFDKEGGVSNYPAYSWRGFNEDLESPTMVLIQPFSTLMEKNAPAYHHDFIYAVKAGLSKPAADATNKTVTLNFRHAFSQVVFNAKNEIPSRIYVEISGIELWGTVCDGKFTLPNESTDDNVTTSNNKTLQNQGVWSNAYNLELYQYIEDLSIVLNDANVKEVAAGENAILARPNTYKKWTEEGYIDDNGREWEGFYISVNCKIFNISDSEKGYQDGVDALIHNGDIKIPIDVTWEQGKKYIYTLKFNGNILEPITFDLTVDDYIDGGNPDINAY